MIKVTVGNNVKRESVIVDENTTLRTFRHYASRRLFFEAR